MSPLEGARQARGRGSENWSMGRSVTRRQFLHGLSVVAAGAALEACTRRSSTTHWPVAGRASPSCSSTRNAWLNCGSPTAANRLRLRVNCYLPVNYLDDKFGVWFGDYRPHQVFSPHLRIGGVKIFADSAWTNEMFMTKPHTDRPDYRGDVYWTPDEFTDLVRSLHDDGWQLATHTCGDAAHDMVLDAYEAALAGADNADHRHRIDHVMAVRDDQVQRMRDLAIIASFQLTWFTPDTTPDVAATMGPERLAWVGRWRDLLEAGVPAVASTDYPFDDLLETDRPTGHAMTALSIATTRQGAAGAPPQPWQADQAITIEQGLDLITRAGAYASFEDDRKGTVSVGKLADLVVLSDDPRLVATDDLANVDVLMTMVGGRVEYCAPDAGTLCALAT